MILRVEVTEADIAAGVPNSCSRCPIALALERAGRAAGIQPDPHLAFYAIFGGAGGRIGPFWSQFLGPTSPALDFMTRFDRGEPVAPLAFDLDFPGLTAREREGLT